MSESSFNDSEEWLEAGGGSGKTWDREGVLIGKYISKQDNVGPNNSTMYKLQVEGEDDTTGVWGSTVLDSRFEEVPVGSLVRIECLGKEVSKRGNSFTNYSVKYKKLDDWATDAKKKADAAEATA